MSKEIEIKIQDEADGPWLVLFYGQYRIWISTCHRNFDDLRAADFGTMEFDLNIINKRTGKFKFGDIT